MCPERQRCSAARGSRGPSDGPTVCLTVGTAGHIDHGKTRLVTLLTGCNTDRLPEEQKRGMTIDLGFATCTLADGRRVGIVDVPGHERFVHNMVAGATGIDVALLVVAADDGVMPQTIEHFHILRLLGIRAGMIALTKIDLASPERAGEVTSAIQDMVKGSFLENATIAPVSAKTGEGFDAFYDAFSALVARTSERNSEGPFRMHVESAFVLQGRGTIVSGVPRSGRVRVGDVLQLLPAGVEKKIRHLQVFGRDAEEGRSGECVAMNVADLDVDEVDRGMVFASPGYFTPSRFLNVRFQYLPHFDVPLQARTAVRVHVGTSESPGHMVLPDLRPFAPGEEGFVQLQLRDPLVAAPGDFYVVRLLSPVRTLGGGSVVSTDERRLRRRHSDEWQKECSEHERDSGSSISAVSSSLERSDVSPLTLPQLARAALLDESACKTQLQQILSDGAAVAVGATKFLHVAGMGKIEAVVLKSLSACHDREPMQFEFPRRTLFRDLALDHEAMETAISRLVAAGKVIAGKAGFSLPDRRPALTDKQARIAAKIEEIFRSGRFSTPRRDELAVLAGMPMAIIEPVLRFLMESGTLVQLPEDVILHKDAIEESRRILVSHLQGGKTIEPASLKDLLKTTRKYAIPLLEFWDKQGLTRRVGNARVLRVQQ